MTILPRLAFGLGLGRGRRRALGPNERALLPASAGRPPTRAAGLPRPASTRALAISHGNSQKARLFAIVIVGGGSVGFAGVVEAGERQSETINLNYLPRANKLAACCSLEMRSAR